MRVKFDLRNKLSIFFSIYDHPPCWPSAATHLGRVVQSWVKITQMNAWKVNSVQFFLSASWWLDALKNNRENYPRKCLWAKEKETWVKSNPRSSANRPSNNWALMARSVLRFPRPSRSIRFGAWTTWFETLWPNGIMRPALAFAPASAHFGRLWKWPFFSRKTVNKTDAFKVWGG